MKFRTAKKIRKRCKLLGIGIRIRYIGGIMRYIAECNEFGMIETVHNSAKILNKLRDMPYSLALKRKKEVKDGLEE